MTTIQHETERVLTTIHETGYWRVILYPSTFEPRRISTLSKCWNVVRESAVSLRGWDYPHVDDAAYETGKEESSRHRQIG